MIKQSNKTMKIAILSLGITGALIFFYSVYSFWVHPEQFKTVAYIFMFLTVVFFILVIINKIREEKALRDKIKGKK
ncbi:MAG: hypothetical protein K9H49_09350 [Bacteroidales bacterium]|nr:hypothetical protein [Bacteroidales bacterium]MCF8390109.1 hypothetical protein [Bacteroidales bacterium]